MKCLMPLNQRKAIAEAIEGKRYVEWGCGGSTVWIAENANPVFAMSVEHDSKWADDVEAKLPEWWHVVRHDCKPGRNATPGEETAVHPGPYIRSGLSPYANVYLIDGVVRLGCLRALLGKGDGVFRSTHPMTIFIHDTQRDWYDAAIEEAIAAGFTRTDYPEGEDYPGCLLTKLTKE